MSIYDPNKQIDNLSAKVVIGIEKISESFKVLLWEYAKEIGISPIQIQIIIFIKNHDLSYSKVSYLAQEFNVSKPTISDAVKVLIRKELLEKVISTNDARSHYLRLTHGGKQIVNKVENFNQPLVSVVDQLPEDERNGFFLTLNKIITGLSMKGIVSVQRTCFKCANYEHKNGSHHCKLLRSNLSDLQLRIDCDEFEIMDKSH